MFLEHSYQFLITLVILVGPIPLIQGLLSRVNVTPGKSSTILKIYMFCCLWFCFQTTLIMFVSLLGFLNLIVIIALESTMLAAGLIWIKSRNLYQKNRQKSDRPKLGSLEILLIALITTVILLRTYENFVIPISEYDSLAYHLPEMAHWYQTQSLDMFFTQTLQTTYAYNWELFSTIFILPFGNDFAVLLGQSMVWIFWGMGVYLLGRHAGAERIYAIGTSIVLMTMSLTLFNIKTMRIDIAFAAFFTAAVTFLLYYQKFKNAWFLFLASLSASMMLGIKMSSIPYLCILILLFAFIKISTRFSRQTTNAVLSSEGVGNFRRIILGIAGLCLFVLLGCVWYIQNTMRFGNPLGFVGMKIFGILLFPGSEITESLYKSSLAAVFEWKNSDHWELLGQQLRQQLGLNGGLLVFSLIGIVLFYFYSARNKERRVLTILVLISAGCLFFYWNTPFSAVNKLGNPLKPWFGQAMRYGMPFLGVLAAISAVGWTILGFRKEIFALIVCISVLSTLSSYNHYLIIVGIFACTGLTKSGYAAKTVHFFGEHKFIVVSSVIILLLCVTFSARNYREMLQVQRCAGIYQFIDKNTEGGEKIGFIMSYMPYLLFGKNLDRIPVNLSEEASTMGDLDQIININRIRYIAVGPFPENWQDKPGASWIDSHIKFWKPVHNKNPYVNLVIYKVHQGK
ncbi:hypothetical protein JW979_04095 [bacterium]|nr:hypothetical protein [candidate division CSSED10-310 bacterium]